MLAGIKFVDPPCSGAASVSSRVVVTRFKGVVTRSNQQIAHQKIADCRHCGLSRCLLPLAGDRLIILMKRSPVNNEILLIFPLLGAFVAASCVSKWTSVMLPWTYPS